MNETILDEREEPEIDNRKVFFKVAFLWGSAFVLFILLDQLGEFLPLNLIETEETNINTIGLLILVLYIFLAIRLPAVLNEWRPMLKKEEIALFVAGLIGVLLLVSLLLRYVLFFGDQIGLVFFNALKSAVYIGIFGSLISYIRIHKLRKVKSKIPGLLFLGFFIVTCLMTMYYPNFFR